MMEEQDSGRIRSRSNNNTDSVVVDRISALPDCILGDILSFLPTTEAVATCLLSKRWKFSWLDASNLDFYFIPLYEPDSSENTAFIRFVNRVLLLSRGRQLNKFSLSWIPAILSHLVCWINAVILRNVIEISCLASSGLVRLPISVFNCHSLRSLQLESITFVDDSTQVCLPRLETLILSGGCSFASNGDFEKLIDGCPVLRHLELYLHLTYGAEKDIMYHTLSSRSLTYLEFCFGDRSTLKLMAPSLEYLRLGGPMCEIFVDKSLSSLVTADLNISLDEHDFPHNSIVGVVRALGHAKSLTLSDHVMKALDLATTSLSTKFNRLEKLEVTTDCCCYLQDLVHNSENLEELVIYQEGWWRSSGVPHDHSRWTDPVVVPRCLSKTLKKVELINYSGLEDERETIRFMLEHGIALEVVQIQYYHFGVDGEKLHKEICEFPRKSPACKVYRIDRWA